MFEPWLKKISISEARRRLPGLLREIQAHPDTGYSILRRGRVVAELVAPEPEPIRLPRRPPPRPKR